MKPLISRVFAASLGVLTLLLAACETTDNALREQGQSDSYVIGFHDGRHSGMKEAGNNWESYLKDHERYDSDSEYRDGWIAGEVEGKRLQEQATAIGNAAGGAYGGYQVGKEVNKSQPHPHKAAKDAMKGVDADELNTLGQ